MKISWSKTREQFPLDKKKIIKKTLTSSLIWFFVLIPLLVVYLIFNNSADIESLQAAKIIGIFGAGYLVFIVLATAAMYYYQLWYFSVYFYDLTDDFIIIKKGPITPHEITIPYERVQDIYVDQDLLDRIFGIYDVHLSSATFSSGAEAHIDGVAKPAADGLRDFLLKTVQQKITKNRQHINNQN